MPTPGTEARQKLAASFKAAIFARTAWRPVSTLPDEGTVSVVCDGGTRSAAGVFKGGEWMNAKGKPLPFAVTHWLAFLDA
jgi:hypothetical protein